MPDILFKCPACQKALAVEEEGSGAKVECVDCKKKFAVPNPEIVFLCSSCHTVLSASKIYHGHEFTCTACNGKVMVPDPQTSKVQSSAGTHKEDKKNIPSEDVRPGIQMSKVGDDDYEKMMANMARGVDRLKSKKSPRWKSILYNIIGYAIGIAILYFVIGIFVNNQSVKVIMVAVISIILLCMILKFCLTSSIYDD